MTHRARSFRARARMALAGLVALVVVAPAADSDGKPCHDGHGRVDLRDIMVVGKHMPDCSVG